MKIRHLEVNRMLLLLIGLWPYHRSKLVQFQSILVLVILTIFIVFQFETFLTSPLTMDLVLQTLFSAFVIIAAVIIYLSFYVNSESVKNLLNRIQHTYDELQDENEIAIIEKHLLQAKYCIFVITMFLICSSTWFFLMQLWPSILDVVWPINKTRSFPQIVIITEYVKDREKYFYLFLLHANTVIMIASLTVLGTATTIFSYGQCLCGMFSVSSYRIQFAVSMDVLQSITYRKENVISERIVCAVDMHRKAIQFCEYFINKFALWFTLMIIFGVLSLSFNLLRKISSGYNIEEIILLFSILFVHILYMFLANYMGQEITDHNNHVFATVYNVRWYIAPLKIQKMLLFLLQRGTKPFNLNLGGIFVGSLEGFATLVSYSISYFTVIYSTRQ